MDSLPVELLRLIFEYCDSPSVRALRLSSTTLATIGYEYLIPPHFTAVSWKDDVKRLHSISSHDRLKNSIQSITFNFTRFFTVRNPSFFPVWRQRSLEECHEILQNTWTDYAEAEARHLEPTFSSQGGLVEEAFMNLPKLKALEITYTKCPYDIDVLKDVFPVRNCAERERFQVVKDVNLIVSAMRHTRISSLTIDQLPFELFKMPDYRRQWFDCASSFAGLSRLDLTLNPPHNFLPQGRFRAINGLGHVLQLSTNLTRLSLGFNVYYNPVGKFALQFHDLFGNFTFAKLTDLKLEGISCAEPDLRSFLLRHASTLERLRLGGRGLARAYEMSTGGVHLHEGTWRSFFGSLRGRLPRLKRFHMEGDCEAGEIMTSSREVYKFRAVTDDNWECVPAWTGGTDWQRKTIDCLELERYLLRGGEYPKLTMPDE
jgi:hypothetical protein